MSKHKEPVTPAIRLLRQQGISFTGHPYDYEEGGGTALFARLFGVDEHLVIKTLIMEDDYRKPLIVLMHGDCQVSTKALARQLGVKSIQPCAPAVADRHSGYQVGGTSPFATRHPMPVYCERTIAGLPDIFINGGKRGYIIAMASADLIRLLQPVWVDAAI